GGTATSTRTREEAERERHAALAYMGRAHGEAVDPSLEMMRLAMASVARTCIVPMQDVLGLGTEARMNRPGVATGNGRGRRGARAADGVAEERLRSLTRIDGRAPSTNDGVRR